MQTEVFSRPEGLGRITASAVMDPDELRRLLRSSGADLWALIDAAVLMAAREHGAELRARRDAIVERLYARRSPVLTAQETLDNGVVRPRRGEEEKRSGASLARRGATTPSPPESMVREEAEEDDVGDGHGRPASDEQSKILTIKEFLEDPDQSEDSVISLLQNLADMDITFRALKETDIGRHVNGLRKHPSNEVRRLVKHLVRKWKDLVDYWVKSNSTGDTSSPAIVIAVDGDSPQQFSVKNHCQNSHHQVPEFGYFPSPHNGYLSSDRSGSEPVAEPPPNAKAAATPPRRETLPVNPNINHSNHQPTPSSATTMKAKEQKDMLLDERLASARKRLHDNYQEAENAKKQRTIQVMDIHQIPKPKGSSVRRGGFQAKHW